MVENWAATQALPPGVVGLAVWGLERGFIGAPGADGEPGISVTGEQDLLGDRIARPPRRRKRADQFIADATEIEQGDLVVHADHGIGRYDGLQTLDAGGAPHDCLRLLYDGGDKLFLPVENIEVLTRFGSDSAGRGARQARRRLLAEPEGEGEVSASRTWRRSSSAPPPSGRRRKG